MCILKDIRVNKLPETSAHIGVAKLRDRFVADKRNPFGIDINNWKGVNQGRIVSSLYLDLSCQSYSKDHLSGILLLIRFL